MLTTCQLYLNNMLTVAIVKNNIVTNSKEVEINMKTEYDNLLESLEDIVGQMQMEKVTFEQALDTLKIITKYYENRQGE